MKGTIKENERYCQKEGQYVHFGLPFIGKGGRRDYQVYYQEVKEGASDNELALHDFRIFAHTLKATDRIRLATKPKPNVPRQVILFVGETGGGKTRLALETWPNLYEMPVSKNMWMDGYQGQLEVLLDEFNGQMPLAHALKLFDNYYVRMYEIKGGFVWFNPSTIIVTSNNLPSKWYDYNDRMEEQRALRRRFTKVVQFVGGRRITYDGADAIRVFWPIAEGPIVDAIQQMMCKLCYYMPCGCKAPKPVEATYNDIFDESDVDVIFNTEKDDA